MPGSRWGAYSTRFLPPWFILFLSRGGPPKPFIPASYSHKDIKKKNPAERIIRQGCQMLYQKSREGEQGNPFRAGLAPERPRASPGGAQATEEHGARPRSTPHTHAPAGRLARTHARAQACMCVCVHRWVCTGLFTSRFPNHCTPSEGPGPLSSGRAALGPPRGSSFVPISRERYVPVPAPAGASAPRYPGAGSFPPLGGRVG